MFLANNDYPIIEIKDCPILYKISILTKNNSVEYDLQQNVMLVCKNYILSKQDLREEFRRENAFVSLYKDRKKENF